jgi:uncharacterized protein (DUF302 family)
MSGYAIRRIIKQPFDAVLAQIPEALKKEGFGVLTEIDVRDTMKKKLNVDFRRYKILGACNPPFAHQALDAELDIGVVLPCNVIVYEAEGGDTVVAAIDPERTMAAVGNPKLEPLAKEVGQKLRRVVASL